MGKMNYRVVSFAVALATCIAAVAQVTRQESTNRLKKVVYSGDPANFQQVVKHVDDGFPPSVRTVWNDYYWAVVPVPEIGLSNMPNVTVYAYYPENEWSPGGWAMPGGIFLLDGVCYLAWKNIYFDSRNPPTKTSVSYTQFKIVVTYEADGSLRVGNLGTGKSLKLDWNMDAATNQVVRGYKVFRQEKK